MAKPTERNARRVVQPYRPPGSTRGPARDHPTPIGHSPVRPEPVKLDPPTRPSVPDAPSRALEGPLLHPQGERRRNGLPAPEIACRLNEALTEKGISPSEAAVALGWPRQRVHEMLNGRSMPGFGRVHRFVTTLGLDWRIVLPEAFA